MPRGSISLVSRDAVAMALAIGIATALNMVTAAVLINAATGQVNSGGLSENGTQVLTGWGGGIIGILGAVFGYRAGRETTMRQQDGITGELEMGHPPDDGVTDEEA